MNTLFLTATIVALSACGASKQAPTQRPTKRSGGDCSFADFEGTCKLTDIWIDKTSKAGSPGTVTVEARYSTPLGDDLIRRTLSESDAALLRRTLAAHPSVPCRGRRVKEGACEPSSLEIDTVGLH